LESLLGKEFKHPRRKCPICNYTVSYSNFKRHLRNAHPDKYGGGGDDEDDSLDIDVEEGALVGHVVDEDELDEEDEAVHSPTTEEVGDAGSAKQPLSDAIVGDDEV